MAKTTSRMRRVGRGGVIQLAAKQKQQSLHPAPDPADHTYRVIELVGTSEESIEQATANAIARAHHTIRHLRWFEVLRTTGHIDNGKIGHFQVTLKVGFTMEDAGQSGLEEV